MKKNFVREKKIYCGEKYLEVDIFNYSKIPNGKRSKKIKLSPPKQRNLNDKNSKRYFTQIVNANFNENDLHVSCSYKNKFLPNTYEESQKAVRNFIRRINNKIESLKKKLIKQIEGMNEEQKKVQMESIEKCTKVKYICVTECKEDKNGKAVRLHHHIIMSGILDRDTVEKLWSTKDEKGKKVSIGFINADRLQPNEEGLKDLVGYLTKYSDEKYKSLKNEKYIRRKRWSQSRNLIKPEVRTNDSKYGKNILRHLGLNPNDREFWEKQYPGYTFTSATSFFNGDLGWMVYAKFRKEKYIS